MADDTAKKAAFVARLISRVGSLLDATDALVALRTEWGAMGYALGGDDPIADADLSATPHLDAARLNAVMGALDALDSALQAGPIKPLESARP